MNLFRAGPTVRCQVAASPARWGNPGAAAALVLVCDTQQEHNSRCFPRRESRQNANALIDGLLTELEDHNCWTIAEAAGHPVPSRLQHLLSRGAWDQEQLLDAVPAWVISELGEHGAVLVTDETSDEKASSATAGAARQYCGTTGDVRMCQAAVTCTYASGRGHALIGRALYLPEAGWAAGEERREIAHVPEEVLFATKPELAASLTGRAAVTGVPARWAAGDEVQAAPRSGR